MSDSLLEGMDRVKDSILASLSPEQRRARKQFIDEIHSKSAYNTREECPYCNSRSFIRILEVDGRAALPCDTVICSRCDGCFKLNILTDSASAYYYAHISYRLRGKSLDPTEMEKLFWVRVNTFGYPRQSFILKRFSLKTGDTIIDVGCGDGASLYPWIKKKFNVIGFEVDSRLTSLGNKLGIPIITENWENISESKFQRADLIILSHVLEHVSHLDDFLLTLRERLKPSGGLYIEVPGIRLSAPSTVLNYFDIEHNFHFDLNSIRRVLEKNGFHILYGDETCRVLCTPDGTRKKLNIPSFISTKPLLLYLKDIQRRAISLRILKKMELLKTGVLCSL